MELLPELVALVRCERSYNERTHEIYDGWIKNGTKRSAVGADRERLETTRLIEVVRNCNE